MAAAPYNLACAIGALPLRMERNRKEQEMGNETRRILLVEDEKTIRDAVAAYLERENYWVTAVGDGQEALEEFSKHHFDLVVLDLMLPRVPG